MTGYVPARGETYLNGGAAWYQVYATADREHVVIGAAEVKFWQAFCEAAGRREWSARHGDAIPQRALIAEVAAFFAELTAAECDARFAQVDCCYSRVLALDEALATAHVAQRRLVRGNAGDARPQSLFPAWVGGAPPADREPLRSIDPLGGSNPWREQGE